MLCIYGCGQEATHQFKNGKWCCSKSKNSCPMNKMVGKNNFKKLLQYFHIQEKYNFLNNIENDDPISFSQYSTRDTNDPIYKTDDMNDGIHLLQQLLEINPHHRICAKQALKHKYFKELFTMDIDNALH